jgi:iron complex transport system ATP-binding protein
MSVASTGSLLSVQGLDWGAGESQILSQIDFELKPQEFVGVIGPNGAGKSSLLRCLYRVNRPWAGTVRFNGQDIWQHSARASARNTAVILQEHTDHIGLSVLDIVALGLTPHKRLFERDSEQDRERISEILSQVDLYELRHAMFSRLSGGEKQRVMLARAMLQAPELLIMDEPTNHLDVHYQIDVLQKVRALSLTVLASFHDLNLAAAFCDRILVLDKGQLVARGTPAEVLTEELISRVFHAQAKVDTHPLYSHPRITYAYHSREGRQ